jgi:cold shock CspA family protein
MRCPHPALVRRAPSLLLALILLLTALVLPSVPALAVLDETFADDFQTSDFTGNTGSLPWTTPWLESGEADGPNFGAIGVWNEPHCETNPCLLIGRVSGTDATVEREADLSRFASATLSFNYKVHSHPFGAGSAVLKVSDDGGGSWVTLDTWSLATDTAQLVGSYDLTPHMTDTTRILFAVSGNTDDSHMNIDNLAITVTNALCYLVGDASGIQQLTSLDLADLNPLSAEVTIGGTGADLRAIALASVAGNLYAATGDQLHTVDTTTGAVTTIGPFGSSGPTIFNQIETLAFDPMTGALYASHHRPGELDLIIQVDPATGSAVADAFGVGIDYVPFSSDRVVQQSLLGLAIDGTGQMWGMGSNDDNQEKLHSIDKTTGTATAVFNSRFLSELSFDAHGTLWGLLPAGELFEMELSSNSRDVDNLTNYAGVACAPPAPSNHPPVFSQDLPNRTDPEGAFITVSAPATDPDGGDALIYTATGLPEGISIDPASGDITGALGPNSSGTHSVTVTVTDDGDPSLQDADVFTWTVIPGEVTYLIANSGGGNGGDDLLTVVDRTDAGPVSNEVNIGTGTGTMSIEAADMQPGSNVLYAIDGDQLGTVDPTTGTFTARPQIAGVGSGSVGLVAFNNIEGLSFNPFTGELFATNRRGDYEADLLFKLDPATGAHIPGAFGGDDYVAVQNQDPYWHAADIAFDPTDGQLYLVHWTVLNLWAIATMDSATGTTSTIGPAPANIVSLAFDEAGRLYTSTDTGGLEQLYELNKTNAALISAIVIDNAAAYGAMAIAFPLDPNQAPIFDQDLLDRTNAEGAVISLSAAATDPDASDNLGYTAADLPPGLTIDPGSGLISGTISFASAGTYSVEIVVVDDGIPNLSATDTFTWTVSEMNQAPVFDQDLPDRSDAEGAVISLSASASDPDGGDVLAYGATGLPPGLSIDPISGLITGTIDHTAASASPYAATITASDDRAPSQSATPDTFTWTVSNTNRAPTITNPGAQTTPELDPFTVTLTATDPDGGFPSFSDGGSLPGWATLTDNGDGTATINGAPGAGASGTTTVTITVSDGPLTDDAVFDLTVTNTNLPPTIINPGNQTIGEGSPISIAITGSDPDGTTVSFTDSGTLPAWATLTDNGDNTVTIAGTSGYSDAATTTVIITVTDGSLTDEASFDLIITNTDRVPVVAPIADQVVAENSPFSLVVSASDPDGTTPSITAPTLPTWATLTDNGDGTATITGTPGFGDAATTPVTVIALDGSLSGTTSFDLTVTDTNRAPLVNAVADVSVAEGSALTPIVITATDPDGTVPSLAATGLPGWATFTDNGDGTATITGTPGYSDAAITTITVNAEDGGTPNLAASTSFDLTVTNTNRPPVVDPIADQTIAEGNPFTLAVTASDPDGSIPALTAAGLPGWAGLVDNGDGSATITGTPGPSDAAITTITVTASDGSLTNDAVFDLTVADVNRPPIFDADLPDRGDAEAAVISLPATATDPDLDNITYAAFGLPPGLAMDPGTGLISGTVATTAEAGSPYAITLTATDSGTPNLTATDTFTWTITNNNQSPLFSQDLGDRADAEGAVISLSAGATDPDLDVLTYSATGLPPGLAISPTTGLVSGTISLSSVGSYSITVTVADSGTPVLTATDSFTWVVTKTNQPPVLAPIGDQLGPEETGITFTATATDPDGDGIEFSLAGAPTGAAIDAATGVFTWMPAEADGLGSHTVTVIVTDDGLPQLTDSQVVTITVTEANLPPTLDPIADQTSNEGSSVSLVVVASDPDLPTNHLSFSASGLPPGLSINGTIGLISGTVARDTVGDYAVTIAVTDNAAPPYLATTTLEWTITDTNKAPSLGRISDQFGDEETTISFTATATDADGDNLTYSLTSGPSGARIGANSGVFTWTPGESDGPGTFTAIVLVTDDGSPALGATQVVSITVAEANLSPTIGPVEDQQGNAGDEIELAIITTDPDLPANELTLSATGLPPGLFLNPATGAIGGTLQATDLVLFTVELTATDHGFPQLSAATSFLWTVSPALDEPDPEAPPAIDEIGNQYTDEGSAVNLAVSATSTGTLAYSATGLPPGLTIDPRTGSITGTVGSDAIGAHAVVVTVTDNATSAQQAHTVFTWTVTDVAAAVQKEDLVQALDQFSAEVVTTAEPEQDAEPVRRSLVVMGSAAAATTESLRWPIALLAALLVGFATVGRVGLYPLLWRGDRQTGTITLYDPELLFGLIEPDAGGEAVHVHANAFPRRMRPLLQIGMRVRYRVLASDNRSSAWGATADE